MNFQSNNSTFFNPSWSNKLYFKGPDGWFYEFKNHIGHILLDCKLRKENIITNVVWVHKIKN
jgi:hypothetical protein